MIWYVIFVCVLLLCFFRYVDRLVRLPGHRWWRQQRGAVLVTGCGSGFGQLFVQRCAVRGCTVFAACRTAEAAKIVEESIAVKVRQNVKAFVMDVTDDVSVRDGLDLVRRHLPKEGLWALVNNAGIAARRSGPLDWLDVDDFRRVMEVNLFGMVRVTKACLPLLKLTRGRIVNVTSAAGRLALARKGPYDSSKFAAEAFSDIIRQELKPFGVSVHIIEPGYFKTAMTDSARITDVIRHTWQSLPQSTQNEYGTTYVDKLLSVLEKRMETASERVDDVIDAYESAVFSLWPQYRYLVGDDARTLYFILPHLPECISDYILTRGAIIPAACAAGNKKLT